VATSPIDNTDIPTEVSRVTQTLQKAGFESYLVGGCVRDLLLGKKPKDWDVTTDATPEHILDIFEHTFYENDYGTVGVVNDSTDDSSLEVVEVTPYRTEMGYSDKRRPDEVVFSHSLSDDLKRRDFTVNAIAYDDTSKSLVDPYDGITDIQNGVLRTVGSPVERFNEDALRLVRAVRLAAEHGFVIEEETQTAITENVFHMKHISAERIRDELSRIVDSSQPQVALEMCRRFGLIPYIIPELEELYGVEQGGAHKYDVWEHTLRTVQAAADKGFAFHVKLAALLHDIGKPRTQRRGTKKAFTFYGHEVVGAKMTQKALKRLSYPKDIVSRVTTLVRWHMFFSDPDQITKTAVRRLLRNIGEDNIWDLINVRICDRIGTGRPKEEPYRLRKYQSLVEEVLTDPVSVKQLKIDGNQLQEVLHVKPGPKIGFILHALLEDVLENPTLNTEEYLIQRAQELSELPKEELKKRGEQGKKSLEDAESEQQQDIRSKYHVK